MRQAFEESGSGCSGLGGLTGWDDIIPYQITLLSSTLALVVLERLSP